MFIYSCQAFTGFSRLPDYTFFRAFFKEITLTLRVMTLPIMMTLPRMMTLLIMKIKSQNKLPQEKIGKLMSFITAQKLRFSTKDFFIFWAVHAEWIAGYEIKILYQKPRNRYLPSIHPLWSLSNFNDSYLRCDKSKEDLKLT